ncbi:MAG: 50S ribosomal protein L35 [Candidatus Omnitrophota bacterium]
MAKLKTRKSVAKRFKITGTGKVMRRKAGHKHLLGGKTPKRKMQLGRSALVSKEETRVIKQMLPYG